MRMDDDLAREWERMLTDMIYENTNTECDDDTDDEEYVDGAEIETFEEAGLLTRDRGIVVYMDGREIHITIQAFSR